MVEISKGMKGMKENLHDCPPKLAGRLYFLQMNLNCLNIFFLCCEKAILTIAVL